MEIHNRRYTGSKFKLCNWIVNLVTSQCSGNSFCDIFSGTSVVSYHLLPFFNEIILNDFLFSNYVIYKAFYSNSEFDSDKLDCYLKKYSEINPNHIDDNYLSENFGGKFFSINDSKIIGHIREDIESNKDNLNEREYNILLASLLYSSDKVANTVGHYDAYIKNKDIKDKFTYKLIKPIDTSGKNIKIYREDANILSRKINSDIVYIDPPYNSRQYSRFYHVLENITKWEKPELEGVVLKPTPENMSEYCKCNASIVFKDLIDNLQCKYIVVSYNNTYNSKSNSSKNKISLDYIIDILKEKGETQTFEQSYKFFNTGKTEFKDHKEFIFITKVGNK